MSFLDSFFDKIGLTDDGYDDEELDDDDLIDDDPMPSRSSSRSFGSSDSDGIKSDNFDSAARKGYSRAKTAKPSPKVTPINKSQRRSQSASMEVCVLKPMSIEDSREITEALLEGRTVVLNLEGLELEVAQRIIDFSSGSCFAIYGNLQKVSKYIFIITPPNVDIFGDFQDFLNGSINAGAVNNY